MTPGSLHNFRIAPWALVVIAAMAETVLSLCRALGVAGRSFVACGEQHDSAVPSVQRLVRG